MIRLIKEINRMAPKGLYTATAPQSTLMRFSSDGIYGLAVMNNGKIVK
ncbi:hypothetical protein ACO1PF_11855 [Alkalibacterium sp. f15]